MYELEIKVLENIIRDIRRNPRKSTLDEFRKSVTKLQNDFLKQRKVNQLNHYSEPINLSGSELKEIIIELGYPIMVTPFSQFVATQATMNVISGERYKMVPDGVIEYIAGYFGQPPAPIEQAVLDKVRSLPKTKKLMNEEFPQPSVKEIRKQMGIGSGLSDEEFLLRYALGDAEVDAMLAASQN